MDTVDVKSRPVATNLPSFDDEKIGLNFVNKSISKASNPQTGSSFNHADTKSVKSITSVLKDTNCLDHVKVRSREKSLNNITNSESPACEDVSDLLFSCCSCEHFFPSTEVFRNHDCSSKKADLSTKPLKCQYCSLTFTRKNNLNKHIIGHKNNNCNLCVAEFTTRKALCKHLKDNHRIYEPEKQYKCSYCDENFDKKTHLIDHLKTHANGQHVCLKCGFMCPSDSDYAQHIKGHSKQSKYDCDLCGKAFVRRQQYNQHMMGHDRHSCIQCSATFSTKKLLMKHQLTAHGLRVKVPKLYSCNFCEKCFQERHMLRSHMKIHVGEMSVSCFHCNQSFRNNRSLAKHMKSARHIQRVSVQEGKVVEIEKRYQCDKCGAKFYRQHSLFRHVELLHSVSKIFKCRLCEYSTNCKPNLKRHEEGHSGVKRFVCEMCGAAFRALNTLKEHHTFLHSEDRHFTCSICTKSFKSKSILQRHVKTHTQVRPFKCQSCKKDFNRLSHLKRHTRQVHNKTSKGDAGCDANQNFGDKSSNLPLVNPIDLSQNTQISLASLIMPISNGDPLSEDGIMKEYMGTAPASNQCLNVPSSIESLIADSINAVPSDDLKDTMRSLVTNSSSNASAQSTANSASLDDSHLNLSPSRFCNFNLMLSPEGADSSTLALHDNVTANNVLSYPVSTESLSLSHLNYHNQPAALDTFPQLSPHGAELQILPFLLNEGLSSPSRDLTLESSNSTKNIFDDTDSLSFSPYACSIPQGCSSDNLFSDVRDIDLWDSQLQNCKFKPSSGELESNDVFALHSPSGANHILPNNMMFSNESLIDGALDSTALNSDLDSLANLC